ncbi:DMT family transporter [Desulfoluna spongiiphila]|uniref:Threonine/homoserine efflux transporter RhtA n=1 Tax=Desulfoluna spongiiphila TaxID=419481 RepID=A0A1G5JAE2_9BACT|nr:DMT family transporter [Desulfoluna spongiiphila]SCY84789.1 Threonine/homoserine efflux transporter RhtA [Desulfoluna spongiiphila]VVS91008.1 eama domain [Desulfoluna spongiiphila]
MKGERGLAVATLLGAIVLWAGSFVALKIAFRSCDPYFVIFGRMAVATCCALLFLRQIRRVDYHKGDWVYLLALGLCEPCLYFVFEAKALVLTSASQAGMITALLPVMVAVGAWMLFNESMTWRTVSGFVLAVAGVCLLTLGGEATESAPNPPLGNFYEFLAMVAAAGYTLVLKRLSYRYSPLFLTFVQSVAGAIFFAALMWGFGVPIPDSIPTEAAVTIVYLGVFVTFGAYFCYSFAMVRMPAGQATAFINLIPVLTLFFGWLILGEVFKPIQFVAGAMVIAGVFLSQDGRSA